MGTNLNAMGYKFRDRKRAHNKRQSDDIEKKIKTLKNLY